MRTLTGLAVLCLACSCGGRSGLLEGRPPAPDDCAPRNIVASCRDGWCRVPAGCFEMGDEVDAFPCRHDLEVHLVPRTRVRLTHSFELMSTEVTQAQYVSLVGRNPVLEGNRLASDYFPTVFSANRPVYYVTWAKAVVYCNALSARASVPACYSCDTTKPERPSCQALSAQARDIYECPGYRLPTEAEWEYAYRAGTSTEFYAGSLTDCVRDPVADRMGWYLFDTPSPNGTAMPQPVGRKEPNGWGLFDLAGNVEELTNDRFVDEAWPPGVELVDPAYPVESSAGGHNPMDLVVAKGGSVRSRAILVRAASRVATSVDDNHMLDSLGFRCARTIAPEPAGASATGS